MKLKSFYKENTFLSEEVTYRKEQISAHYTSDRRLVSRIHKDLKKTKY